MVEEITKPRLTIDTTGWKKIGKGALIAGAGAVLTYLAEVIPGIDFGVYTPLIVALAGIAINACIKFISKY